MSPNQMFAFNGRKVIILISSPSGGLPGLKTRSRSVYMAEHAFLNMRDMFIWPK